MIQSALNCIDDMRQNVSGNVPGTCDLQSLMVEPQPGCCSLFDTPDQGTLILPSASAYNDALLCLEQVGCRQVSGDCAGDDCEVHGVYEALEAECYSHTVHEECRTSCGNWPHDGKVPLDGDCECWDVPDVLGGTPEYRLEDPNCMPGTVAYDRFRGDREARGSEEARYPKYDWWQCWYSAHCITELGTAYYPPTRDVGGTQTLIYGDACTTGEQEQYDAAVASGIIPLFDCVDGGIPVYCSNVATQVIDRHEDSDTFNQLIPMVAGINVPAGSGIIKREPIDCRVDSFACRPTESGTGRPGAAWWTAVAVGLVSLGAAL